MLHIEFEFRNRRIDLRYGRSEVFCSQSGISGPIPDLHLQVLIE